MQNRLPRCYPRAVNAISIWVHGGECQGAVRVSQSQGTLRREDQQDPCAVSVLILEVAEYLVANTRHFFREAADQVFNVLVFGVVS